MLTFACTIGVAERPLKEQLCELEPRAKAANFCRARLLPWSGREDAVSVGNGCSTHGGGRLTCVGRLPLDHGGEAVLSRKGVQPLLGHWTSGEGDVFPEVHGHDYFACCFTSNLSLKLTRFLHCLLVTFVGNATKTHVCPSTPKRSQNQVVAIQ